MLRSLPLGQRLQGKAREFVASFDTLEDALDAFDLLTWDAAKAAVRYYRMARLPDA